MLQLVGTLTATSHIHQTSPEKNGNESPTIKTKVWGADGREHTVPYVTGNSIRGVLRRKAATIVLDALGAPVSRAMFSVLTTGKASRKDIGMTPTTTNLVDGGKNIFAGMFGGGGYMLSSRYSMGHLLPMVDWCRHLVHHAQADKLIPLDRLTYETSAGSVRDIPLTTTIILTSRDDIRDGKGETYIEDYQKSVDAWLSDVQSSGEAKKALKAAAKTARAKGEKVEAEKGATSLDVRGYNLIEAMLPGTPLQFNLRFGDRSTEAQIGLMLMAVRDWANDNVIGGASARGFGTFDASIALYDGEEVVCQSIFGINDHATAYELSPELSRYLDAAALELSELTVDQLETAFAANKADKETAEAA